MKNAVYRAAVLCVAFVCGAASLAQDKGTWHAASKTASSITGDIAIAGEKLAISLSVFPIAQIRPLTASEIAALFGEEGVKRGAGFLYKVSISPDHKFLRKNTLCGAEETQWITTAVQDKVLHVAMFSGSKMPQFTVEEIINSTDLCGTFSYTH